MKVISTEKIPIKIWTEDIEESALEQTKHLANLPFAFKHIAIMSDVHKGMGMPIGGVLATKNVVICNAVGSDIGCGVCVVKTSLTELDKDTLKKIMGEIRKVIPVGFNHHRESQGLEYMPQVGTLELGVQGEVNIPGLPIVSREYNSALKQVGTLGGGNHFLSIEKGSDGFIWIMIHSGSRNLGKQVADHYNKLAVGLNQKWFSQVPKEWELAFLPIESEEGKAYLREMNYCVEFALANRKLMMDRIKNIFYDVIYGKDKPVDPLFEPMINIAHNLAS